ncbi:MAG: hypothetical protein ACXAES_19145 [Promethearchaeota archaeon]
MVVLKLANLTIDHHKKKDLYKTLKEAFDPLFKIIKPEMERIWPAIKKVGFSGRLVDAEAKWKNAALECFDDSKKGFEAIKREDLEDESLYFFTVGKEKRDFESRLLKKIIERAGLGTYGGQNLRDIYRG